MSLLERDVFAGSLEAAAASIVERALGGEGGYVSLLNVHLLTTARREEPVAAALRDAWRVFPDGAPIAWLRRREGASEAERVPGPDLMLEVLRQDPDSRLRHVLFGSTDDVLGRLVGRLRSSFPSCRIERAFAPPRGEEHEPALVAAIREAEPHVVWVGLGAPKQELWALRHAAELAPALVVCIGAAFDFNAGTKRRAPAWMQVRGLEWLYRLASEPLRLGPRYLRSNGAFLRLVARDAAARELRR